MQLYWRFTLFSDSPHARPCLIAYAQAEREVDARLALLEEISNIPVIMHIGDALAIVPDIPPSMPYERLPTQSPTVYLFKMELTAT